MMAGNLDNKLTALRGMQTSMSVERDPISEEPPTRVVTSAIGTKKTKSNMRTILIEKLKSCSYVKANDIISLLEKQMSQPNYKMSKLKDYLNELRNQLASVYDNREEKNDMKQHIDGFIEKFCVESNAYTDVAKKMKDMSITRKATIKEMMIKLKDAENTDLAFLLDCTGSMAAHINAVKNDIQGIVDDIHKNFPDASINIAFVGYRDHCDFERIVMRNFSAECASFSSFLVSVKATGGGDEAEDVFGGLDTILQLNWTAPCRVLMHFADAPCHGNRFHDSKSDTYASYNLKDKNGLTIEDLLSRIKEKNILYYFGKINDTTDKMITQFRQVNNNEYPLTIDAKDAKRTREIVSKSVHDSISGSIASAFSSNLKKSQTVRTYKLINNTPNWKDIPKIDGLILTSKLPYSMDLIKNEFIIDSDKAQFRLAPNPFGEGGQRISYYSLRMPSDKVVLKQFIMTGKDIDLRKNYMMCMETQTMAAFFASEFNKISPKDLCKPIEYLAVCVVQFVKDGLPIYYNMEDLLPDYDSSFIKWSNNSSYVNHASYSNTIDAFSHWSYIKSAKYLMVVDLQGIDKGDKYLLTDPAIHCEDVMRFGATNLSEDGISMYLKRHKCNSVCIKLGLDKTL